MGIHYQGWDASDVKNFLSDYGISNASAANDTYEYILGEPANYLKYYIGYLKFLDLQKYAKKALGEKYTDRAFHEAVLRIGPAPFDIIKKYLLDYIPGKWEVINRHFPLILQGCNTPQCFRNVPLHAFRNTL